MIKNIPIYDIVVDLDDPELHMTAISLVDYPAVEKDFMCFKEQHKLDFTVQNEDQHLIFGPAILCDVPIYRYSPTDGEYYVRFTREAIENIIFKYSQEQLLNVVSLQHNGEPIQGATMVEFFLKDTDKGIDPKGYEDCPNYSLFVTYKITDEKLWDEIKNGNELKGYSIEVTAELKETDETVEEESYEVDPEEMDVWDLLTAILGDDVELLYQDEKKKSKVELATDWSVIEDAIEGEKELKIKYGNKTVTGTPYAVYQRRGSSNVAIYSQRGGWHILNEKDIRNITATGRVNSVDWIKAVGDPSFDWVSKSMQEADDDKDKDPDIPKSVYERAILEHKIVMITYIDEVGAETGICVSSRQCGVFEYGYTTKESGRNAAIRVYEYFGSTHHPEDMPGWRTLRLDRIRSFKFVEWMEPLTVAPAGFRERGMGEDLDGFVCLTRSDLKVG